MELTWYGRTCIRLKGKDAVVVADPYQSIVGPTGRGITGEIVTYSHPDDRPLPKAKGQRSRDGSTHLPSSLEDAFVLDGPGESVGGDVDRTHRVKVGAPGDQFRDSRSDRAEPGAERRQKPGAIRRCRRATVSESATFW